jgi:tRNA-specific 2-thiouridylase
LHRARDPARDQSYFLYRTTRAELDFLRFPLGGLDKSETRALAHEFALPVAQKPDSQDICFVPQGSYAEIVARLRPEAGEPGDIIDERGALLGRHDGIAHFTVGQRKGIGIAAAEPLYVLRIEPERRRVVVGPKSALAETRLSLGEVNWLGTPAQGAVPVAAKLRSAQKPVAATFHPDTAELILDEPAGAVAPGQAAVLYDGDRVLGGGWIRRTA